MKEECHMTLQPNGWSSWQHEKLHRTIEPFLVVALFSLCLMPLGVVWK